MSNDEQPHLSEEEEQEVRERSAPEARIVHAAVVKQGEDELARPLKSLFWSGVAAGFGIMASVWAQAALHHHLPDAPWREAVAALGYSLGFLIVILGRMQLFTEQTMVAVLPLARAPSGAKLARVAKLWTVVFLGNLIGTAAIAALCVYAKLESPQLLHAMLEVSGKLLEETPGQILLQGVPAG
ncbi:MAG TPA: formate/nitrite transporter family protein, partial [Allosphingosinicella sp.]|nr:formate/nitrite transporter family protein [Allosphingosinicella sp.]